MLLMKKMLLNFINDVHINGISLFIFEMYFFGGRTDRCTRYGDNKFGIPIGSH